MINEYAKLAIRTCKELSLHEHMSHMAMGISSEYFEYLMTENHEHTVEEIGDIMWYLACLADVLNIELTKPFVDVDYEYNEIQDKLCGCVEKLISAIKKVVIYGKQLSKPDFDEMINNIVYWLYATCENESIDFDIVLKNNIDKLAKRYPEKYTDKAATERLDKVN